MASNPAAGANVPRAIGRVGSLVVCERACVLASYSLISCTAQVLGLARDLEASRFDGALSFEEACHAVVPLKLSPAPPGRLEQPIIVSRELGTLKIGDLPLRSIEGGGVVS